MIVGTSVITLRGGTGALRDDLVGEQRAAAHRRRRYGGLKPRQRLARVAAGQRGDPLDRLRIGAHAKTAQPAFFVVQGPRQQFADIFVFQRFQGVDDHARKQRLVDLKPGIFRSRTDKDEVTSLDGRQQNVLLFAVEMVDLIDKGDRGTSRYFFLAARALDKLAQGLNLRADGVYLKQHASCSTRDEANQRSLSDAGRPVEDAARSLASIEHTAQCLSRRKNMPLSHIFVENTRPHTLRERHLKADIFFAALKKARFRHRYIFLRSMKRVMSSEFFGALSGASHSVTTLARG